MPPRMQAPVIAGTVTCGCKFPPSWEEKAKIKYCPTHKERYPLATGAVKNLAEKQRLKGAADA